MENRKINEILSIAGEGRRLRDFINVKLPQIREDYKNRKGRLDKHRDGFEQGDAIQSFNIKLSYQCFSGYYGDSSVYSDFSPNNEILSKYFLAYLNKHTVEIFNEMADMMIKDAALKKEEALNELDTVREKIETLLAE